MKHRQCTECPKKVYGSRLTCSKACSISRKKRLGIDGKRAKYYLTIKPEKLKYNVKRKELKRIKRNMKKFEELNNPFTHDEAEDFLNPNFFLHNLN